MLKSKRKSILIVLCVLVGTILFICSSILIYNAVKNYISKKVLEAAVVTPDDAPGGGGTTDEYIFTDDVISSSSSEYQNNTVFKIGTFDGLLAFSRSVAENECTYDGKIVKLTTNITGETNSSYNKDASNNFSPIGADMWNNSGNHTKICDHVRPFKGEFDGCNYTVSNITTTIDDLGALGEGNSFGFFSILGDNATVKNLRIKNFAITICNKVFVDFYAGAIAGSMSNTTIEHCVIDGFIINSQDSGSYYGGIVGHIGIVGTDSKQIVKNVLLKDFIVEGSYNVVRNLSPGFLYDNYEISNCVAAVSNDFEMYQEDKSYLIANNVITSDKTTTGLDCDSIGGTSETVWYYADDYNDSYPYLRAFIGWKHVFFDKETEITITIDGVSDSSIQIPEDANETYVVDTTTNFVSSSSTIYVYNREITASVTSSCSTIKAWYYSSNNNTYNATKQSLQIKIKFLSVDNTRVLTSGINVDEQIDISCGATIYITYGTQYEKEGYLSINFSFMINGEPKSITYIANSEYFIIPGQVSQGVTSYEPHDHLQEGLPKELSVLCEMKQYGVVVQ